MFTEPLQGEAGGFGGCTQVLGIMRSVTGVTHANTHTHKHTLTHTFQTHTDTIPFVLSKHFLPAICDSFSVALSQKL